MNLEELNKLKNQYYILDEKHTVYCSKCGKKLMRDTYQYGRHEKECGVKFENKYKISKNEQVFGFSFRIIDEHLLFNVYRLGLEFRPGFKDRYHCAKWKNIFAARFSKDSRVVEEKGLYNIDIWFKKMIDLDGIVCLNKYDYIKIINEFFASIHQIYNLGMFLDLYRDKGYKQSAIKVEDIQKIEQKILDENELAFLNSLKKDKYNTNKIVCICDSIALEDDVILRCSLYDCRLIYDTKENISPYNIVYLSKNFIWCENNYSYEDLFKIIHFKYNNLNTFIEKYPELMIKNYLDNNGQNIFNIILSSNYNKCIELTAKAGITYFSDHFDLIKDKINPYGKNIDEMFGLPLKIVRSLNSYDGLEFFVGNGSKEALIKAYEKYPVIFEENVSKIKIKFMSDYYKKDRAFKDFTEKDLLKACRYFDKQKIDERSYMYEYYKDYLNMCRRYGRYVYGFYPDDINFAHNEIQDLIEIDANRILLEQFKEAVDNPDYKMLASDYVEEGTKEPAVDSEVYEIVLPKTHLDLIKESAELHHCVKTYIDKVSNGQTYILFLRKKEEPDKPLATIEVLTNKMLIQLKAYCNSHAEKKAQNYVKKWAKAKGLTINSYDFD